MKLGKAQKALLAVTVLFVVFTLSFFLGRRSVHAQITTERAPDELVRQVPEAEPAVVPEELTEGTRQTIPARVPGDASARIDINRADQTQLETLPGIGPVLAERIVEWRGTNGPFVSAEQIMDVEGIGEGKYAEIKDLIYVEDGQ